jgi:cytochrome c peroxidase
MDRERVIGRGLFAVAALALISAALVAARITREPAERAAVAATTPFQTAERLRARAAIGKRAFFDPSLSEPAGTSCASCHDPARGYAGDHGSDLGVPLGSAPGHFARRVTPSVLYLAQVRRFHFRWEEDAPLPDAVGGFFWDGRTDSIRDLVRMPMLNADEMGNRDAAQIAQKVRASAFAEDLARELGPLNDVEAAVTALSTAVESFLLSDEMAPYSSRYDDYVRGVAKLTPVEARGLAAFKDPAKGNCAFCHKMNDTAPSPERSPFSDYAFEVVGVPRNARLPANRDAGAYDLGLCEHEDGLKQTTDERFCGAFRTPSLRNVAVRPAFMHNGAFTSLRDVVEFYATRATDPMRWYRRERFDDLPRKYREYVNEIVAPYDRAEGGKPALDEDEIDAVVAFLGTLTDARH